MIASVRPGSSPAIRSGPPLVRPFCLPPRRHFNPYFRSGPTSRDNFAQNLSSIERMGDLNIFHARLHSIQETHGARDEFDALLERILGWRPVWELELSERGDYYVKYQTPGSSHSSLGLGDGLLSLFVIVDALPALRTIPRHKRVLCWHLSWREMLGRPSRSRREFEVLIASGDGLANRLRKGTEGGPRFLPTPCSSRAIPCSPISNSLLFRNRELPSNHLKYRRLPRQKTAGSAQKWPKFPVFPCYS